MTELRKLLDFAVETAFQAGKLSLGYFQTQIQTDFKTDDSPVTVADRLAETLIRERISAEFPDHGILGEEFGEQNAGSSFRWIIDPIDGTKSFMRGVPLYAVLIGLEREGQVVAGVSYFPAIGDMVYASLGEGCFWNGRKTLASTTKTLDRAVVSFTDYGNFARYGRTDAFERLAKKTFYRVGWSDAYGHMLVATGRCDIMLDPIMNVWDCGPFGILLKEAGGYFGDWQGRETIYGNEALSCNQYLKDEVLALVAKR